MNKKLILLGLVALVLLAMTPAYAAPPQTIVTTTTEGLTIVSPTNDYIKANNSYTFNYHIFNSTSGMPLTSGFSCTFHAYALVGTHIYVRDNLAINNNVYDVGVIMAAGNFTKGFYNILMQCNTSTVGGVFKQQFEVTNTGIEPATDTMIIFSYLLFMGTIILFIYLFVYGAKKFGELSFDMTDLTYNILAYIFLLVTYTFNRQYFGIEAFAPILLTFLATGGLTMIAVPIYFFVICYMKNLLDIKMGKGSNL